MKRTYFFVLLLLLSVLTTPTRASLIVEPGSDLFETEQPTTFLGFTWEGVPLGTFDFGAAGLHNVGLTDTIVKRLDQASVAANGDTSTIDIELVALQLRSAVPIDLGAGMDVHFITLDTSQTSAGQMAITFDDSAGGTFDSFFDVFFDVRIGDITGPILASSVLQMTSTGTAWGRTAPSNAVQIDGVNVNLAGANDPQHDFWPTEPVMEMHPSGAMHTVGPARIPVPVPYGLLGLGLLVLGLARRGLH